MSSLNPCEHKRIGRGVHIFDCAFWGRVPDDVVLANTFVKFAQNPTMKQHLVSTGVQILAKASSFDPVWGIGCRADEPEAQDLCRSRGEQMLGNSLPAVCDTICASEIGLAHPASSHQLCTPITPDGIHEISPAPPRPLAVARAFPRPPFESSTCFSNVAADYSLETFSCRIWC